MADTDTIIRLPAARESAILTMGGGRSLVTTRTALGLALLATAQDDPAALAWTWQDHLATHGVAIGARGRQVATLAIIPAAPRTIRRDHNGTSTSSLITPPPIFAGLRMEGTRFQKGVIFIPDLSRQAQMSCVAPASILANWPHGNVYEGGAICWGGVNPASIRTMSDLTALFFGSGFNSDLRHPGASGSWGNGAVWAAPAVDSGRYTVTVSQAIRALFSDGR